MTTMIIDEPQARTEDLPPPDAEPRAARGRSAGDAGVRDWVKNVKVNALWGINQPRNAWVHLTDGGWKRLAAASDAGVMALTILAANAKATGATVNCLLGDDGTVQEMYVW